MILLAVPMQNREATGSEIPEPWLQVQRAQRGAKTTERASHWDTAFGFPSWVEILPPCSVTALCTFNQMEEFHVLAKAANNTNNGAQCSSVPGSQRGTGPITTGQCSSNGESQPTSGSWEGSR